MTDITTIFDQAATDVFDTMGVDATFTPSVGDPVSCKAVLDKDVEMQPSGYDAQVYAMGNTIEYLLDEVGKEADRGETFLIGSDTWTVQSVSRNDGRFVKVIVK